MVLFGCSHDNGYARALEECSDNPETVRKVVLLEGVPFEKELLPLPYLTTKFPSLFRQSKIALPGATSTNMRAQSTTPNRPSSSDAKAYNMLAGMPTRFPAPAARPPGLLDSPIPSRASLAMTNLPRTPSSSTLSTMASDGLPPMLKPAISWAAKAAAPVLAKPGQPAYKPTSREDIIARNRSGQRIDPVSKDYDKAEVDRIKKMKMCNVHFLRNECPYENSCTHLHSYKPTVEELATLRLVARMSPCVNGSACQEVKCIYGHRCPAPPHRTNHVKGTKSCIFGESCKFPPDLHDVDTNIVKTLVVR